MSQETMEGEVSVAVMEEKPSPFLGCLDLDSPGSLIYVAVQSWWGCARPSALIEYVRQRILEPIVGEVKFSMVAASKGGFDIKIGPHMIHAPKYASARHPLVRMMLFARNMLDDKFSCPEAMVPRSILDMIRKSRSVSRSTGITGEPPVESIGMYAESELGCTAIPSAIPLAIAAKEDEDAAYHDDAMGGADTLADTESIAAGLAPAASPHEQNKIMNSRINGWDNYTGYMDGVREVTHTEPEHNRIMEAKEKKTSATWVVATAAAYHATGNRGLLFGFTPYQPGGFVESADGAAPMQVLGHGSVITDTVVLPNVLYVPGLTANLVSASQLAELDYTVGFSRGACLIRSAADGTIVGKASVGGDGLFQLDFLQITGAIDKRPVV
ncbi:uncharacterized protein LOC119278449 [Triticum dicoccoides]|uniref:uncharacterized protein LOC119278449 n=1 Tax=Triticum dicoccoides TaxID=85692 RepID=UPI00189030EB|nr:uncharacterized protein LOC119278449 [Triticum dicoccoides]